MPNKISQSYFISATELLESKKIPQWDFHIHTNYSDGKANVNQVFKKAIENVKPVLEVKSRRIGGANYQVPIEVPTERRTSLAIRWLITYSKDRSEKSMSERLANEFIQASKNEGGAVRKKVDTHKMAEANKAFAHFRW